MKKIKIIVIIILILLILGVSGYVLYDKVFDKDVDNIEGTEYIAESHFLNYLTEFDLVLNKAVWNNVTNECKFNEISISKSDINKLLTELSTKKLIRKYYGDTAPAGADCLGKYDNSVIIDSDGIIWSDDNLLLEKLSLDMDAMVDLTAGKNYIYQFDVDFATIINNMK